MTHMRLVATRPALDNEQHTHSPARRSARTHALSLVVCLGLLLFGCVPVYAPPTSSVPHALLKMRRRYGSALGPALSESFSVDDRSALAREISGWDSLVPATEVLRVHPGRLTVGAEATFWHMERDPGYPMGYCGGPRLVASCYSPSRTIRVIDAACSRSIELEARAGEVYLLELDFVDASACRLVCYQQKSVGPGRIQMMPCVDGSASNPARTGQ